MKAVILAAGVGSRLAPVTNTRPKALVEVAGKPMLFRQLDHLAQAGIAASDIVVVGGYLIEVLREQLAGYDCKLVLNEMYEPWGNFYSLLVAKPHLVGHEFLQLDGDTVLDGKILPKMIAAPGEALLATDTSVTLDAEAMKVQMAGRSGGAQRRPTGNPAGSPGEPAGAASEDRPANIDRERVVAVSKQLDPSACIGEYIGVTKLSAAAGSAVFEELGRLQAEGITHEYYEHAYHRLTARGDVPFGIVDVRDCTVLEIDDHDDLARAEAALQQ